ncbi:hypothetical protein Cgig2_000829 [Carnegiea gigantea]|uniref:Uncharacterized protein n=1 Tax=Carnegiea gigantea TaxID=171969 RepID=A0A9Q1KKC9_9CARY|nr:hypothetical protein Cgig2_000829 [Carnegiea gigantea]
MRIRLNHLPVSLEQRPSCGSCLIIFLCHWSSGPLCESSLITFLRCWSNRPSYRVADLDVGEANISSCIAGAADLLAGQPNLSTCTAGVADLFTAQANSSSHIVRAADLFAGQANVIDEVSELSVSASNFDQYLRKHSILFIYMLWILIDIECPLVSSLSWMPACSYFAISKRNASMWWWETWLVLP